MQKVNFGSRIESLFFVMRTRTTTTRLHHWLISTLS